jgi:hypothetical protein
MKRLVAAALAIMILLPGAAFAGSSTDAALGLGAFAVFNQILGGVGIFGRPAAVVAAPPVVYTPPPAVVYEPPPTVVYEPPPAVVYGPPPPPMYVSPAPVFIAPHPVYAYRHNNRHFRHGGWDERREHRR